MDIHLITEQLLSKKPQNSKFQTNVKVKVLENQLVVYHNDQRIINYMGGRYYVRFTDFIAEAIISDLIGKLGYEFYIHNNSIIKTKGDIFMAKLKKGEFYDLESLVTKYIKSNNYL